MIRILMKVITTLAFLALNIAVLFVMLLTTFRVGEIMDLARSSLKDFNDFWKEVK